MAKQTKKTKKGGDTGQQLVGGNGKFLTEALFWETSIRSRDTYPPLFTLKDRDHEGCRSFKQEYLRIADPSEYRVAMELLGSWQHWQTLCACSWFKPYVEQWRGELAQLLLSQSIRAMADVLADPEAAAPSKLSAARYLAEQGWKPKNTKGRPSKADINKEARRIAEMDKDLLEDYNRIMN